MDKVWPGTGRQLLRNRMVTIVLSQNRWRGLRSVGFAPGRFELKGLERGVAVHVCAERGVNKCRPLSDPPASELTRTKPNTRHRVRVALPGISLGGTYRYELPRKSRLVEHVQEAAMRVLFVPVNMRKGGRGCRGYARDVLPR